MCTLVLRVSAADTMQRSARWWRKHDAEERKTIQASVEDKMQRRKRYKEGNGAEKDAVQKKTQCRGVQDGARWCKMVQDGGTYHFFGQCFHVGHFLDQFG